MHTISMTVFDWAILAVYLGFVVWIGFILKKYTKTDEDYFLAGRRNTAFVAGVAFMSANMGALEVVGYAGQGAEYGLYALHFYLIGAIPAILFLGIFMMPFYYNGRIKSTPGYLKERYDEKTRVFNAISFSLMTVLSSGISLYALALVLRTFLGWNWNVSIWFSAGFVALYITLSGLMSAIFTEVIQFFLIWGGILLLPILGIVDLGGPLKAFSQLPHAYTSLVHICHCRGQSDEGGLARFGFRAWVRNFLRILDDRFSNHPTCVLGKRCAFSTAGTDHQFIFQNFAWLRCRWERDGRACSHERPAQRFCASADRRKNQL